MSPEKANLLRDALERVIANPTACQRWHCLLASYEETPDADAHRSVRQSLLDHVCAEGIAGFFRATFLAGVTTEVAYIADAGRIVQDIRPIDPQRLVAFAAFEWGRALARGGDRTDFATCLRDARLPEIMHLAGTHLSRNTTTRMPVRNVDRVHKVALVAAFIGLEGHTPTALTLQHARILRELGLEVRVFSGQELLIPDMPEYLGNCGRILISAPDMDVLARLIPSGVNITLGDAQFSLMRRWQSVLAEITTFDPDLVLFVGLNSPLVAPLYAVRPVVGLCVHSIAPMVPVDVWLTATPSLASRWGTPWAPAFPPAWGHYHPYRIALKAPGKPLTRAQLGIAEESLVLVTVGARLGAEVTGEWAARMIRLLYRSSRLVWLLVGGDGAIPSALGCVPADRLLVLGHSEDIRGILRLCDIFINPPRVGGGFSVAEAMAEGLSVVAFADSDGGNKVGAFAVENTEAYFTRLHALIEQPALREQAGTALRAVFSATLDLARSGPSLLEACDQATLLFRQRMKSTISGDALAIARPRLAAASGFDSD